MLELGTVDAQAGVPRTEESLGKRLAYVGLPCAGRTKEQHIAYGPRRVTEASAEVLKNVRQHLRSGRLPHDFTGELLEQQLGFLTVDTRIEFALRSCCHVISLLRFFHQEHLVITLFVFLQLEI